MSPDGMLLVGRLGAAAVAQHFGTVDSVGGLTLGADPIAYAIAHHSATTPQPLRAFTVRKEAKVYGAGRLIEGPFKASDRVVVIEDVITSGSSALRAANAVRDAGATVAGILALVDREEGGRELLEAEGFVVASIATATEILARGLTPEDQTSAS